MIQIIHSFVFHHVVLGLVCNYCMYVTSDCVFAISFIVRMRQ